MKSTYYWIWGKAFDKKGNLMRILNGAYESEEQASQAAFNINGLQPDYEIIPLDTRDTTEASRRLRYKVEEENGMIEALQKFRHKV